MVIESELGYQKLERKVAAWANHRPDLRAILVVGSRARSDPPPDMWSDLDLILLVDDPDVYTAQADWLTEIGEVWLPVLDRTSLNDPEWLIWFDRGLKADFLLARVSPGMTLAQFVAGSPHQNVFRRGLRVLVDKTASPLPVLDPVTAAPPTETEFTSTVGKALLAATRTARLLRRSELWQAKQQCDAALKAHLLKMLEWHARALYSADTWYDGRYMAQWADPQTLEVLSGVFARYEEADIWRALFATLTLFRRLAQETAARLGYAYPTQADSRISAWLESAFTGRT